MAEERVFIALGSNLGDRRGHLEFALAELQESVGVEVVAVSRLYETAPVGPPPQGPYLNAAVEVRSALEPAVLLERQLEIEARAGRVRGPERNAARPLDLDLLLFGERVVETRELVIPHPRLHERGFVLEPLRDLAAEWLHPTEGLAIGQLADRVAGLSAAGAVRPCGVLSMPG